MERHLDALTRVSKEVDSLKLQIEQAKLTKGETLHEVTVWSSEVEAKLGSVDEGVVYAGKRLIEIKREVSLAQEKQEEAALLEKRKTVGV